MDDRVVYMNNTAICTCYLYMVAKHGPMPTDMQT